MQQVTNRWQRIRGHVTTAHPDDLGPIGGRGDTWGVHWGYADYPEGVPWNSAGALDQGRAYRRALEQLERFGDPNDPVAVRIGPLAERGSALDEVIHETTGTLAEVRAQVTRWQQDYRTAAPKLFRHWCTAALAESPCVANHPGTPAEVLEMAWWLRHDGMYRTADIAESWTVPRYVVHAWLAEYALRRALGRHHDTRAGATR